MPIDSTGGLVEAIRRLPLLAAGQVEELGRLQPSFPNPRALAKELLRRGWLTPYQINQLFAGHGSQLVLGQYVLLERIGEGGMGQVVKARHLRLERLVALKLIRKERLASPGAVQRFQREARAAARLSHPNIVTVYDADEVAGVHYFAMEYVEGADLAKLVQQQGPLTVRQACDYVRQAALGLQHAHDKGLVHRDVKPANLLLTTAGQVKVLDMGLARLDAPAGQGGDSSDAVTAEGSVMGTPDYMAPEQATDSHKADARADLYSLGCTLCFLLTGRPPFSGGTLTEKLLKHQTHAPPSVEAARKDVPPVVAAIMRKLMAKRPADRCQKATELAAALAPFCGPGPPLAIPIGETLANAPPPREQNTQTTGPTVDRSMPAATPAETVLLPQTKARWWKGWTKGRPRLALLGGGVFALLLAVGLFAALWRGQSMMPWADKNGGKAPTWPLDELPTKPIPQLKELDNWPPKDLVLVLGSHRGRHWGPVRAVAYSPDGTLVASGGDDGLVCVWKADTLEEYREFRYEGPVNALAFLPNGRLLSGGADKTVRLLDVESGKEVRRFPGHTDPVTCVAVSSDGKLGLSGAAGGADFSVRVWDLVGDRGQVQCMKGHTDAVTCVGFCDQDTHVLSASKDSTVRTWDWRSGAELHQFKLSESRSGRAFSPDRRLMLVGGAGGGGSAHLWDVDKQTEVPGVGVTEAIGLCFSPDGRRAGIALHGDVHGLDIADAESLRRVRGIRGIPGDVTSIAFSPDSRRVLFGSTDGMVRLWDIDDDREIVHRPGHGFAVRSVALSKDGRYVLTGGEDKTIRLWDLASAPPGREVASLEGPQGPVGYVLFSPDESCALSGDWEGTGGRASLWNLKTGEELHRVEGVIIGLAFDPETASPLAARVADGFVAVTDVASRKDVHRFEYPGNFVRAAVSANGRRVAAGTHNGWLVLWDAGASQKSADFHPGLDVDVNCLGFSADSRRLVWGCSDGSVRLWEGDASGSPPIAFAGHKTEITSVVFSRDDTMVAASAIDGRVIVWDAATRERRFEWKFPGAVLSVAFDEKSRYLATANGNGTVFLLRLREP